MNKKDLFSTLPYIYFLVGSIYWIVMDVASVGNINWIAVAFALLFSLQAVYKNKLTAITLGSISVAGGVFMFLAVLSEFRDFPVINEDARQLLLIGTLLSISVLAMGSLMLSRLVPEIYRKV